MRHGKNVFVKCLNVPRETGGNMETCRSGLWTLADFLRVLPCLWLRGDDQRSLEDGLEKESGTFQVHGTFGVTQGETCCSRVKMYSSRASSKLL